MKQPCVSWGFVESRPLMWEGILKVFSSDVLIVRMKILRLRGLSWPEREAGQRLCAGKWWWEDPVRAGLDWSFINGQANPKHCRPQQISRWGGQVLPPWLWEQVIVALQVCS